MYILAPEAGDGRSRECPRCGRTRISSTDPRRVLRSPDPHASALALLRDAIAEGVGATGEAYGYALVFRHSMDLEALRGDPDLEALLQPRG
jgi:hypothetical protein